VLIFSGFCSMTSAPIVRGGETNYIMATIRFVLDL